MPFIKDLQDELKNEGYEVGKEPEIDETEKATKVTLASNV